MDEASAVVSHSPRLVTDDFATLRRTALDGADLVCLPKFLVQGDIDGEGLGRVLPEFGFHASVPHAVFASRRGMVVAEPGMFDALVAGFHGRTSL